MLEVVNQEKHQKKEKNLWLPEWASKLLSKLPSYDLKTQHKIISRLSSLGLLVITNMPTFVNTQAAEAQSKTSAITQKYSAQIPGGHGNVLKLIDGTTCLITNEHVTTLFENSSSNVPLRLPQAETKQEYLSQYDLQIVTINGKPGISCNEAFLKHVKFKTNKDVVEHLNVAPQLTLETALTSATVLTAPKLVFQEDWKPRITDLGKLIKTDRIIKIPILAGAYSAELGLILYSIEEKGTSSVSGTSGSVITTPNGEILALHSANLIQANPLAYDLLYKGKTGDQVTELVLKSMKDMDSISSTGISESGNVNNEPDKPDIAELKNRLHVDSLIDAIATVALTDQQVLHYVRTNNRREIVKSLIQHLIKEEFKKADINKNYNPRTRNPDDKPKFIELFQKSAKYHQSLAEFYSKNQDHILKNFEAGKSTQVAAIVSDEMIIETKYPKIE